MATTVVPSVIVDSQPRVALPYGLFSVLTPRTSSDTHWTQGIQWEAMTCEPAGGIGEPSCDPDTATTGLPKDPVTGQPTGSASVFTVYGSAECTPVGTSPDDMQDRATAHLLAREEGRVEQALWTGDLDNTGFAADATSVGDALDPAVGLGLLENWIATNYGSLGVMHMTREVATVLLGKSLLKANGTKLTTVLGTPVVAGGGYPGTDPDGSDPADGTGYIYVTPALVGYRSDVFPAVTPASAGFNPSDNNLTAVAERSYAVGFDPCGSAVANINL